MTAPQNREYLLEQLAAERAAIVSVTETLEHHRTRAAMLTEQLLAVTNELPEEARPLEHAGLTIRHTAGRTVTTWDAEKLASALPYYLAKLCISYTPKTDNKVLSTLVEAGKLPEEALAARTIIPPNPRWVVEPTPTK